MSNINKKSFKAKKINDDRQETVTDWIVVEEALQININGKPYTVTMRMPGNDEYLVRGLLYTEDIYRKNNLKVKIPEAEAGKYSNTIGVWIEPNKLRSGYYQSRSMLSVSSCGICGKRELQDLAIEGSPLKCDERLDSALIEDMFGKMLARQANFAATGGAHAAACFGIAGKLMAVQEDIGRHNAVDKVIGELITTDQLNNARCLLVSGRISFEIVSKCFKAGIPYLAAVSSPSSMAIECAHNLGITLLAFCRGSSMTCYTHEDRLINKTEIVTTH